MLDNFESISPTAIFTAYPRTFTDIPYEKKIYEWLSKNCNDKVKIASASIHYYEEPCISGKNGSGTVFFSNCNLKCIYCQMRYKTSTRT